MVKHIPPDLTVIAIISVYNEADIIGPVARDLVDQGILVYLIDDGSTDGTLDCVNELRGEGLIGTEQLADTMPVSGGAGHTFSLRRIMARKEQLACQLDADWFINHDADEFRESPWPGLSLREAIALVDHLGYNAIDFEVLDFWPTAGEQHRPGSDPRPVFQHYERGRTVNKLQARCWRQPANGPAAQNTGPETGRHQALDLVSTAGHEAVFAGRRIFPLRFLLRHYPFRSQAHAARKLHAERRAHYDPEEVEQGWHVQYRGIGDNTSFLRDPKELTRYDPDQIRLDLLLNHRFAEQQRGDPEAIRLLRDGLGRERDLVYRELLQVRHQLEQAVAETASYHDKLVEKTAECVSLHDELRLAMEECRHLQDELDSPGRWLKRCLAWPFRTAARRLKGC